MNRIFGLALILIFIFSMNTFAVPADSLKQQKKHKPSDTVGVVNKSVIYYADFRSMLYATMKSSQKDSIVTDSAFSLYVERTWNKLVSDALIEEEIVKRKMTITPGKVIAYLVTYPPKELREAFVDSAGNFDTLACKKYLTNPNPDPARARFIDHYHIQFEQDRLFQAIAPKSMPAAERHKALETWLSKQIAKAKIIDRRSAFGYY